MRTIAQRREWAIVLGLVAAYLWLATYWQGINLFDDSIYLNLGRYVRLRDFTSNFSYAPLYAYWFKLLGFFLHDPIWRYMASWGILVAIVSTIPRWLGLPLSWLYTLLLVLLPVFNVDPYVSLFASIFLVAALGVIVVRSVAVSTAACIACGISFVLAFIRPEYAYNVMLSAAFAGLAILLDKRRGSARAVLVKVAALAMLVFAIRYPIAHSPASRSGYAFSQHFNIRAIQDGRLVGEPAATSRYAMRVFHLDQGPHADIANTTISDFYRGNPRLFVHHLLLNLRDGRTFGLILLVLLLAALPWTVTCLGHLRAAGVYLLLISVPILSASVLIYPRPHYAVAIFPAIILLGLQTLSARVAIPTPPAWLVVALGALLMFFLAKSYRHGYAPDQNMSKRSDLALMRCLRDLNEVTGPGNGKMIDFQTVPFDDVYFPSPLTRLAPPPDWPAFVAAVDRERPFWILSGGSLQYRYKQTPEAVSALLTGSRGYVAHPCPESTFVTVFTSRQP